jgi:predicted kinase
LHACRARARVKQMSGDRAQEDMKRLKCGGTRVQQLLLFRGLPAVGKTTLAETLSRSLGVPLLSKDDVKECLPSTCDDAVNNEASYVVLERLVQTQLRCGLSAICESPLGQNSRYTQFAKIARGFKAEVVLIDCQLNEIEWRKRCEQRAQSGGSLLKPTNPEGILAY